MNENIDLTKILKYCPEGWKFYSTVYGTVKFDRIDDENPSYPIVLITIYDGTCSVTPDGKSYKQFNGECTLFPSKDQRDWSKVDSLWRKHDEEKYGKKEKKEKFNPQTLHEFDKVLVRDGVGYKWNADFYSYKVVGRGHICIDDVYIYCISYNDETKHLLGTASEALYYYRYWEV